MRYLRDITVSRGLMSVRIGREEWRNLLAEDVAWVTEWQLAATFAWLPVGEECRVHAEPGPDESGRWWSVSIRLGQDRVFTRLPTRDLARMIQWCHQIQAVETLLCPPAWVRASILSVQRVLRQALHHTNPLDRMGYAGHELPDRGRGSHGGPDPRRS